MLHISFREISLETLARGNMFGRRAMMRDEFGKEADINTGQIFGFPFFASAAATADILTYGRKG
jgi:hypothetical protein